MAGSEGEIVIPDAFYLVNDPSTGERDATLEVWQLGKHSEALREEIGRITEMNGGEFGHPPIRDEHGMTPTALVSLFGLATKLPRAPKESQFITIGEERSCAIRVSYPEPYDTPPYSHPGIDTVLGQLIGNRYITIKRRVIRRRPRGSV